MDKWTGKVAVVTGASAGIGASIALELANKGMIVVGLARRVALIEELAKSVTGSGKIFARKCDLLVEAEVLDTFEFIRRTFNGIDVLISNAGFFRANTIIESENDEIRKTFDLNVIGSTICIKETIKIMRERNVKGHIIILNSILGHRIPDVSVPKFSCYPATKYALSALCQTLRQELHFFKAPIKVTSVSPGLVDTDFLDTFDPVLRSFLPKLTADDVRDAVLYALGTPDHVRVDEIIMQAMFSYD